MSKILTPKTLSFPRPIVIPAKAGIHYQLFYRFPIKAFGNDSGAYLIKTLRNNSKANLDSNNAQCEFAPAEGGPRKVRRPLIRKIISKPSDASYRKRS